MAVTKISEFLEDYDNRLDGFEQGNGEKQRYIKQEICNLKKNREVFYNCPAVQLLAGNDESGGSGPMQYLAEVILKCLKLTAYNNRINAAMSAYKRATSPFDVKVDD